MSGAAILWAMLQGTALGILGVGLAGLCAFYLTALVYRWRHLFGHKVGGLWHWRLGRVGGSFYVAKR